MRHVKQAELLKRLPGKVTETPCRQGRLERCTYQTQSLPLVAPRAQRRIQWHLWGGLQSVVSQRFRDVSDEIRAVVISGLGDWVFAHPADYLQDVYLKYIGWALSDRVPAPASMSCPPDNCYIYVVHSFCKG